MSMVSNAASTSASTASAAGGAAIHPGQPETPIADHQPATVVLEVDAGRDWRAAALCRRRQFQSLNRLAAATSGVDLGAERVEIDVGAGLGHDTALAGGGGGVEVEGVEQNEVAEVSRNDLIRHARWRQPHYYSVWDFPSARAART
ncbi:hypothetical protein [Gordonia sp. CNJ-863]|uniref:hypothetical protein n=1 Tax=Gordonia sp. CNJ-863 TaxID=1904963 RepID=UPI0013011C80|nr:hypothetical protein [Gordonia sp. CNJ-863]